MKFPGLKNKPDLSRPLTFKRGGIHPPQCKYTAEDAIQPGPMAPELTIMLSQSLGAPSRPVVKKGDRVAQGQPLAEPGGFIGAWIHSPCAGTVKKIETLKDAWGYPAEAIIIERLRPAAQDAPSDAASAEELPEPFYYPPLTLAEATPEQIIERIKACGIVGLGGATFPTAVKLTPPKGMTPECIILNGAECEPYLTCDDRLMRERAAGIVTGARLLMKAAGVGKCYIGIEQNKPQAIEAMRKAAEGVEGMQVCELIAKYPQGGEKQLIAAILGREVPSGALPVSVGAIVDNVATAYAIFEACCQGKPLTSRVVTVTGEGTLNPGNYLVEIGTPLSLLLQKEERVDKIISGGPMMGRALSNIDAPTTKGMSGVLTMCLDRAQAVTPCVRCGSCYEVCPMGLEPMMLARMGERGEWESAARSGVMDCIECGSCVYTCPASRKLLDWIRLSKAKVRALKK